MRLMARSWMPAWVVRSIAVAGACVMVACVGGGGQASDPGATWESAGESLEPGGNTREGAAVTRERAESSREGIGSSAEPGPGAQGAGGAGAGTADLACAGTYSCVVEGDDDVATLVLSPSSGGCTVSVEKNTALVSFDGNIYALGQRIGSWQATGTGIRLTIGKDSVICTKGGSSPSPSRGSSSTSGSNPDTGNSTVTPRDAG